MRSSVITNTLRPTSTATLGALAAILLLCGCNVGTANEAGDLGDNNSAGDSVNSGGDSIGVGDTTQNGDAAQDGDMDTSNNNLPPCTLTINPGDDFVNSFAQLSDGDTLCLSDGVYQQAMDIPSNMNVRAVNDGGAEIDGGSTLGEQWGGGLVQMKGNNSSVRGLRVHHAHTNAHTCFMGGTNNTIRAMSCSHAGSHKHMIPLFMGGSGHLVEDSWFFGKGRYVVQCFQGRDITLRRNLARWDVTTLDTPSEPNAAFAIYNCSGITIENNISLDYGLSAQYMKFGGDFYSPQNCTVWPEGNNNNHYLGNYAVNHAVGNANRKGLRFEADCTAENNVVKDFYVRGSDFGIVISSKETGLAITGCTFENIVTADISGGGANSNATCAGSADIGARYVDRLKVAGSVFPWVNEALIKADLCRSGERQSEWCASSLGLESYLLGQ